MCVVYKKTPQTSFMATREDVRNYILKKVGEAFVHREQWSHTCCSSFQASLPQTWHRADMNEYTFLKSVQLSVWEVSSCAFGDACMKRACWCRVWCAVSTFTPSRRAEQNRLPGKWSLSRHELFTRGRGKTWDLLKAVYMMIDDLGIWNYTGLKMLCFLMWLK